MRQTEGKLHDIIKFVFCHPRWSNLHCLARIIIICSSFVGGRYCVSTSWYLSQNKRGWIEEMWLPGNNVMNLCVSLASLSLNWNYRSSPHVKLLQNLVSVSVSTPKNVVLAEIYTNQIGLKKAKMGRLLQKIFVLVFWQTCVLNCRRLFFWQSYFEVVYCWAIVSVVFFLG